MSKIYDFNNLSLKKRVEQFFRFCSGNNSEKLIINIEDDIFDGVLNKDNIVSISTDEIIEDYFTLELKDFPFVEVFLLNDHLKSYFCVRLYKGEKAITFTNYLGWISRTEEKVLRKVS